MNRENPAEELIRMKQHDLEVRQRLLDAGKLQEGYAPEMEAVHLRHSRRLEEILAETGYPSIRKVGREASEAAWFLIQHSISRPDFMRRMLALLRSLPPEEIDAKQTACLEDRIRMYEGKKQLYGTQFDWDEEGRLSPVPCDDLRRVAERREKLGFPPLEQQIDRMRREQTFFPRPPMAPASSCPGPRLAGKNRLADTPRFSPGGGILLPRFSSRSRKNFRKRDRKDQKGNCKNGKDRIYFLKNTGGRCCCPSKRKEFQHGGSF